jgi:hypothetical protein
MPSRPEHNALVRHVLCGLAANPVLPPELVERLIAVADSESAVILADREDLSHAQAVALASRDEEAAVQLAYEGRLMAADVDPTVQPLAALALLDEGAGDPGWIPRFAADPVAEHRMKLAGCPGLPPDVVEALADDPDESVVGGVASHATPEMAARLARHPHAEVREAVAFQEVTPPAVLAMLITGEGLPPARRCYGCDRREPPFEHDPSCLDCELPPGYACDGSHQSALLDIYKMALWNPATPAEAAATLVGHEYPLLRGILAGRHDLLPEAARQLATDPSFGVRCDLAENPVIDDTVMRMLAADQNEFVLRTLAENPVIDDTVMHVLAADQNQHVLRTLAANPSVPLDLLTGLAGAFKNQPTLLPRIAAASHAEVEELAASPDPVVRMLLAQRRDLPAEIREALATDPVVKVVKSIAPHPGFSEAQLRAMDEQYGIPVRPKLAANPDAPPELLEELAQRPPPTGKTLRAIAANPSATGEALRCCLADEQARRLAAAHPALPTAELVGLLTDGGHDEDWKVVEAAAANPALPLAVMSALVAEYA